MCLSPTVRAQPFNRPLVAAGSNAQITKKVNIKAKKCTWKMVSDNLGSSSSDDVTRQ